MEVKFDVQVNEDQRSNNPQNGFIGRDEGDIEELLENMVIVGEDRDEDIQWDRVVEDVEDINSSQEDNIRGVDQILRQDSSHGDHNENPIRMWANPNANEIEATVYRPGQDTILSDVDAAEAFNQLFNNQSTPTQTLQVAAEEHHLNQNSDALGGFEDIGNIKWAVLEDEGAHGEEAPNNRGEHLTTNTNTQYDTHGFYVEEDGEPLEPEEANSLMKKIIRRDQFNVPDSEPSEVPEIMLEHDSLEEAVSNRDIEREEFESEYQRAQNIGLVNGGGNLTLKGWLSAVDLQAGDLRELEEVANGQDTVGFDTGLGLYQIATDGVVSIDAEHPYMVNRSLNGLTEGGTVNFREDEMGEELEGVMEDFSWMGLDSSELAEEQEVTGEISFSQYLEDFHDVEVEHSGDGRIVLEKEQVNRFLFEELAKNATYSFAGDENLIEEIDIRDGRTLDFEKNISVMRYSDEGETDRIDIEDSDLPEEIVQRIKKDFFESLEIETDRDGVKVMYEGTSVDCGSSWEGLLSLHEGDEGEFEFNIWREPLEIMLEPYQDEINMLQENYDEEVKNIHGPDIPDFHKASDELLEGIREMEELGWFSTKIVEDSKTEIEIQASDPLEYRETIQELKEIENLEFGSTYSMDKEAREARISWGENERVPLDSVSANIEVAADDENEIRERLDDYEEELEDNIYISTRKDLKDELIPKLKHLVHEESGSNPVTQLLGKVIPEVDDYSDKERVKDYENLAGSIDYAEPTEGEEETEPWQDCSGGNWEKALSEELLEELGEMYEEGLIDVELDYDVRTSYQSERVQMPDIGYVEDYHEVGDEDKERLRELDRRGLISLDEGCYRIDLREELEADEVVTVDGSVTVEPDELEMDEEPVELEGEYRTTGDGVYEANEELRRIAEHLDPLNFQKDSYEDVAIQTDFKYENAARMAV